MSFGYDIKTIFDINDEDDMEFEEFEEYVNRKNRKLAEDVICGLYDMINENNKLRYENEKLKAEVEKNRKERDEEFKNMQQGIANTLNKAIEVATKERYGIKEE